MKFLKRLLSLTLSLLLCLGLFAGITPVMAAPTCYQQSSSPWGPTYIGSWTMAESGCGILSTVNAVNYLTGNFINPIELGQWAYSKNYYNGSYGQGTVRWNFYPNVTAAYGAKYGFKITGCSGGGVTSAALVNHLKAGGAVIVHVPNHFMALTGYNSSTGQYLVYDSSAAPKRNTSIYGSWLTAAQLNSNSLTVVDWYCLVSATGSSTVTPSTPTTYTVKASVASGSGSVHFGDGITSASVTAGTVVNYQTTPASGYRVSQILVGGTAQTIKNNGADAVYQFTMPSGNVDVVVSFEPIAATTYTATTQAGSGGVIHFGDGVTQVVVTAGTTFNYRVTPDAGYHVSSITINGSAVAIQNNGDEWVYQITMPAQNTTIAATFAADTHTATAVAGAGGTVHFGNGITTVSGVATGFVFNYQVTPDAGYRTSKITINGIEQSIQNNGEDWVYQITMPSCDTVITAEFTANIYTVKTQVGTGGVAHFGDGITEAQVGAGTIVNYRVTPDDGYIVSSIKLNDTPVDVLNGGAETVYNFTSGNEDVTVYVTFELNVPKVEVYTYRVQCGRFSVKTNADNYCAQIKAAGFDAYIVEDNGEYVVNVGVFGIKSNADAYAEQIAAAGFDVIVLEEITFKPATLAITLDSNDEVINTAFGAVLYSITPPVKSGCVFKGYYSKPLGEGSRYFDETGTPLKNYDKESSITLYALWETSYVVKHFTQKLEGKASVKDLNNYDLADSVTGTTYLGKDVSPAINTYYGLYSPAAQTVTVSEGGTTVISYYYTQKYGDVDDNNTVDATDIAILKKSLLGTNSLSGRGAVLADTNDDGVIDLKDLLRIKLFLADNSVKLGS